MMDEAFEEIHAAMKAAVAENSEALVLSGREERYQQQHRQASRREVLCLFDPDAAAEFIDTTFSWGERGFDFLRYFDPGNGQPQEGLSSWALQRRLSLEKEADYGEVDTAIQAAVRAGLLVRCIPSSEEAGADDLFYLARSDEVMRFLQQRLPESSSKLERDKAQELLREIFNRNGHEAALRTLSGYECLSYFTERTSFTAKDMFNEPRLYVDGVVQFSPRIRQILEPLLYEALQCGLVKLQFRPEGEFYTFTQEGKQIVDDLRALDTIPRAS